MLRLLRYAGFVYFWYLVGFGCWVRASSYIAISHVLQTDITLWLLTKLMSRFKCFSDSKPLNVTSFSQLERDVILISYESECFHFSLMCTEPISITN